MAKFLLIGCTSTIGKNLIPRLISDGHEVDGIRYKSDCLISEPFHSCQAIDLLSSNLGEVIRGSKADYLVLAAWITLPGIYLSSEENTLWLNSYALILDEFKRSGGSCIVGLGSCAEYYSPQPSKTTETDLAIPESEYGKAKVAVLDLIQETGLEYLWTRTFFQYGADDPHGKFIKAAILALSNGGEFYVFDPLAKRDYVYFEDVVFAIHQLISRGARGVFNIGTGQAYSNLEVAQLVHQKLGYVGSVRINDNPPEESLICSSNVKVSTAIGFHDWTTLQEGISLVIKALTS